MIYITGDTHIPIDVHKLSAQNWPDQNALTKDDYLIICGDFGLIWNYLETGINIKNDKCWSPEELWWLGWLNDKPFTTLWIDGNHENFDRLKNYPVEEWNGGQVQKISDSVIHLKRGQIFTIDGKKIFTMGGAESTDRGPARGMEKWDIHKIWWKEETPSEKEWGNAIANLKRHNNKVDYIITHDAPGNVKMQLGYGLSNTPNRLWEINDIVDYKRWYCGHLHQDKNCGKVRVMYCDIIPIGD